MCLRMPLVPRAVTAAATTAATGSHRCRRRLCAAAATFIPAACRQPAITARTLVAAATSLSVVVLVGQHTD